MVIFPYLTKAFCQFLELQSGPLCSRWAHTLIKVLIVIIFPKKTNMIPHALGIEECGKQLHNKPSIANCIIVLQIYKMKDIFKSR